VRIAEAKRSVERSLRAFMEQRPVDLASGQVDAVAYERQSKFMRKAGRRHAYIDDGAWTGERAGPDCPQDRR
jgi:hypothetical protein